MDVIVRLRPAVLVSDIGMPDEDGFTLMRRVRALPEHRGGRILAITITAAFSISRTMMARIAPISMMSQFFGLYALSGTATAFLGHASVTFFTGLFHSQRAGFASTIILLIAGLVLMHWVREERAAAIA